MKTSWVLADNVVIDPTQDLSVLKTIGNFWGSWRTWRACQTDHVICYEMTHAQNLLSRQFQTQCNFYIPNSIYTLLDRPDNVILFEGAFVHDLEHQEEIVAMHLAASSSDIVLLLGFDWQDKEPNPNKLLEHKAQHYNNLVKQVIADNPNVQWVLVDHPGGIRKRLSGLENLTQDSMKNVIELLSS
jgi:polysaccharide pyruvyl transferase WcaK-like protein